jgi:FkbM family methyltransferase
VIPNRLRSAVRTAQWTLAARDRQVGRCFARARVPRSAVRFRADGLFELPEFGLVLSSKRHLFVGEALPLMHGLRKRAGADFSVGADGELHLSVNGLSVLAQTSEDIFILHEIFVDRVYEHWIDRPAVVWDIGGNVGFASLYFAQQASVRAVVSFEPFKPTHKQALRNLALNPTVAARIDARACGVAATDRRELLDYQYQWKGHAGTADTMAHVVAAGLIPRSACVREEVVMRSAVAVLDEIAAAHPGVDLVAKIDCEGCEYEIVEALGREGRLRALTAVMIEWHTRGTGPLTSELARHGFAVFSRADASGHAGMLYAARM